MGSRAATLAPAVLLLAACGPTTAGTTGGGLGPGTGAGLVATDAGATGGGSGPTAEAPKLAPWVAPPAPADDGFDTLWALGEAPAIPAVFGKLRPWMTRGDAARARPGDWGSKWSYAPAGKVTVTLHAGQPDESDNPIELLSMMLEHPDVVSHLHAAWGAPQVRGYDGVTACWLAPTTKLKACYARSLEQATIDVTTYVTLADALAGDRRLDQVAGHIGASRRDLIQTYPLFVENLDPDHRWIEVHVPATEYAAEANPDRLVFYLDRNEVVDEVALRFGANDPTQRPAMVAALRAAGAAAERDGLHATILEDEPIDVVVVLSRAQDLR